MVNRTPPRPRRASPPAPSHPSNEEQELDDDEDMTTGRPAAPIPEEPTLRSVMDAVLAMRTELRENQRQVQECQRQIQDLNALFIRTNSPLGHDNRAPSSTMRRKPSTGASTTARKRTASSQDASIRHRTARGRHLWITAITQPSTGATTTARKRTATSQDASIRHRTAAGPLLWTRTYLFATRSSSNQPECTGGQPRTPDIRIPGRDTSLQVLLRCPHRYSSSEDQY